MTPDELVSLNLTRARGLRGWTQQEAAERISKHLGKSWSVPVYAAAERAHRTARVKTFSATELVALSLAFDLPITWWLTAPASQEINVPGGFSLTADDLNATLQPDVQAAPALAVLEHLETAQLSIASAVQAMASKEQR